MSRFSWAAVEVCGIALIAAAGTLSALAQEPAKPTKATYLLTGLHCSGCAPTIENSLAKVKGIRSIKVNFDTKNALIEFDESVVSAQRVAKLIADTPHMMGGDMKYAGWLALKVPDIKDDASAKPAKDALAKVAAVKQVAVYPAQHAVGVGFAPEGNVTSRELIETLGKAGIKAENY